MESESLHTDYMNIKIEQLFWKIDPYEIMKLNVDILNPSDLVPTLVVLLVLKDSPTYNKDTYSTTFIAALFIIDRNWKELNRGMDIEKWYIYTMEY